MGDYRVGDRVRIVSSPFASKHLQAGAVGTISRIPSRKRGDVEVDFGPADTDWGFRYDEIEHAEYKPAKGDRVRVVYEGVVTSDSGNGNPGFAVEGVPFFEDDKAYVSVEKIEPPVEAFKPGDVVRNIYDPSYVYALADDGYINLFVGCFYKYGDSRAARDEDEFTSDTYEKVNLGCAEAGVMGDVIRIPDTPFLELMESDQPDAAPSLAAMVRQRRA